MRDKFRPLFSRENIYLPLRMRKQQIAPKAWLLGQFGLHGIFRLVLFSRENNYFSIFFAASSALIVPFSRASRILARSCLRSLFESPDLAPHQ